MISWPLFSDRQGFQGQLCDLWAFQIIFWHIFCFCPWWSNFGHWSSIKGQKLINEVIFQSCCWRMSLHVEVKEVTLGWGSFQDTTLYQVQPGTTLRYALHTLWSYKHSWRQSRFRPGPDCIVEEIRLFTNYPSKDQFQRDTYRELRWQYTNQRYVMSPFPLQKLWEKIRAETGFLAPQVL